MVFLFDNDDGVEEVKRGDDMILMMRMILMVMMTMVMMMMMVVTRFTAMRSSLLCYPATRFNKLKYSL